MEIQIKKTVKAGNSSAVILPKAWLNKEVKVELIDKTPEKIFSDVIEILKKYIFLKDIIGIYLTGSYARGEEEPDSDIDILVITNDIDKKIINEGIYNILIISLDLLHQKLKEDLFPVGQMIKEAKSLLNSNYLESININVTKRNVSWYIKTTEDKLKLIKRALDATKKKDKRYVDDLVIYTLVLRLRTLYIIDRLIKNEDYSTKDFVKIIKRISGEKMAYEGYLRIKNNLKSKDEVSIIEAEKLYEYLNEQLKEIKKLVY